MIELIFRSKKEHLLLDSKEDKEKDKDEVKQESDHQHDEESHPGNADKLD